MANLFAIDAASHGYNQTLNFTLKASGAVTAVVGATGTAIDIEGLHDMVYVCEFTNKATAVNDTCDVYVDYLIGTKWINAVHFTQALGNGTDAATEYAISDSTAPGTAIIVATTDAVSTAVRPALFGSQVRARWTVVNGTTATFTFSVHGYGRAK